VNVIKFGGVSLASGRTIVKVLQIIKDDPNRTIDKFFQPGKRSIEDEKGNGERV